MDKPVPQIPGFTVLELAGRGGMGAVYIAEQHSPRRTVALKVVSRAPRAETLAEFRREAEVIAGLEHPRIVPLYGYGETDGLPYLVMRYLPGGSLADRIPMDLASCERWLAEIAAALDFAHGRGLVHRDVKPSNILLDEQGNAYLSDFGIAGTEADVDSTLPSGSAAYMAPEQGRGEAIDPRADTYSLAVTLFEALTGQQPYTAESSLGVIARHMHYPIPSARELNPSISPAVDEALRQGMAKDPGDRPSTTGEFARQVVQAPQATLDAREPAETVVGQARSRSKWMIGAIAIATAAIALIGGGALLGMLAPRDDTPRPTATPPAGVAPVAATESEQLQPTPLISAPAGTTDSQAQSAVLLADDFSVPGSGFAVLSDEDGGVEYADGALQFTVLTDGVRWYSPSTRLDAEDVVIEATAQLLSGPAFTEVALLCRWRDLENYTALAVRDDGSAAIWQLRDGETDVLQDWAAGFSGFPDVPIDLRATCRGEELRLEAAGMTVSEALDPFPISGDIALMAGLGDQGRLIVLFDDVRVRRTQGNE